MAPPERSAARRARLVAIRRPLTPSRWRSARRPCVCSATTAVELLAREIPVGPGALDGRMQRRLVPVLGHAARDDLLRQDVERPRRHGRAVEDALADAAQDGRALHELVEREREEPALRDPLQRVAGAAHTLEERRDRARGADLDDQVHVADVDPELERRRRDERAELAGLQALLGVEPPRAGEAAVVARDRLFAEQPRELCRDALGHLARVHEDERRRVLAHQVRHPGVDLLPLLVGADRGKGGGRDLDPEVELAEGARVDERAIPSRADQESAHLLQGLLSRRKPDPLYGASRQRVEPFERQGEVAPPLVPHEGVDFVHDDRRDRSEHRASAVAREQQVERLRSRHQDVRRPARHGRPVGGRRIPRPHEHPHLRQRCGSRARISSSGP